MPAGIPLGLNDACRPAPSSNQKTSGVAIALITRMRLPDEPHDLALPERCDLKKNFAHPVYSVWAIFAKN